MQNTMTQKNQKIRNGKVGYRENFACQRRDDVWGSEKSWEWPTWRTPNIEMLLPINEFSSILQPDNSQSKPSLSLSLPLLRRKKGVFFIRLWEEWLAFFKFRMSFNAQLARLVLRFWILILSWFTRYPSYFSYGVTFCHCHGVFSQSMGRIVIRLKLLDTPQLWFVFRCHFVPIRMCLCYTAFIVNILNWYFCLSIFRQNLLTWLFFHFRLDTSKRFDVKITHFPQPQPHLHWFLGLRSD